MFTIESFAVSFVPYVPLIMSLLPVVERIRFMQKHFEITARFLHSILLNSLVSNLSCGAG